ncbi:MAG: DNA primase large subunit PriL [Methanocella sp. PtaU1.Bin125]|nr:MAG: DNA primase large subunit PriL [Methanocella sp. PtaU1.Bin125]
MDTIAYAKYPFTLEASLYVKDRQYSIEDVIVRPAYEQVRTRAKRRILDAIGGNARPGDRLPDPERELLSYPVARIMVASTGDQYLIKRFAVWESKRAYSLLLAEPESGLIAVGSDFGINARIKDREFVLHFTDYLKYAAGLRDTEWKLINRKIISGMVYVPKEKFARLLEEAVREKVQSGLTGKVPETVAMALEPYMAEIRAALDVLKAERNIAADGEVSEDAFPPCMKALLADLQKGVNLPHTARFALTSFLANIGLDKEQIMELYRMAPDFREDLTRYQVEHITGGSGTEYTAPSCKTMMTYGNCIGKNPYCDWVTHPLSYYRKAMFRRAKLKTGPAPATGGNQAAADDGGKPADSR